MNAVKCYIKNVYGEVVVGQTRDAVPEPLVQVRYQYDDSGVIKDTVEVLRKSVWDKAKRNGYFYA